MALKKCKKPVVTTIVESKQQNTENTELKFDTINKEVNDTKINQLPIFDLYVSLIEELVHIPRIPKINEGKYIFRIESTKSYRAVNVKYGIVLIEFSFFGNGIKNPIHITIPYTYAENPNSPFVKFLSKFKSVLKGPNITLDDLKYIRGVCYITHNRDINGDVYEALEVLKVESSNN